MLICKPHNKKNISLFNDMHTVEFIGIHSPVLQVCHLSMLHGKK